MLLSPTESFSIEDVFFMETDFVGMSVTRMIGFLEKNLMELSFPSINDFIYCRRALSHADRYTNIILCSGLFFVLQNELHGY